MDRAYLYKTRICNTHQLICDIEYLNVFGQKNELHVDTIVIYFDNRNWAIYNYLNSNYCSVYLSRNGNLGTTSIYTIEESYLLKHSLDEICNLITRIKNLVAYL